MTKLKNTKKAQGLGAIIGGAVIVILLLISFNSFTIIGGGERGVIFSKIDGIKDNVLGEGLNFKTPFFDKIIRFEVRTKKYDLITASTSADQQIVQANVVLNYRLNPVTVNKLYQEVGKDFENRIIRPALEGSIKTAMAKFKAENLIKEREKVMIEVSNILKDKIKENHIIVEDINIIDLDFSEKYDAAIEAKVEAEQQAKKAENDLARIKIEAEQKVVRAEAEKKRNILEAEGEAEAIKIKQEALQQSAEVLEYKWIETWDGKLPTYYGGSEELLLTMDQTGKN
jgi:regulator of protease activity HflC (stomatin/prohibitin superfamily)